LKRTGISIVKLKRVGSGELLQPTKLHKQIGLQV